MVALTNDEISEGFEPLGINFQAGTGISIEEISEGLSEMQYDFENRIGYLEDMTENLKDEVGRLKEIIHQYQHLFEGLATMSKNVEVCSQIPARPPSPEL